MRILPFPLLSIGLLTCVWGCGSIVVRIGNKEKPRPEFEPYSSHSEHEPFSAEDWFADFQNSNEDETRIIIEKIREGLRKQLRQGLNQVELNLQTPLPMMPSLDELALERQETPEQALSLTVKKILENWAIFLESQRNFLRLDQGSQQSQVKLDEAIIGLFFDFGINFRGESRLIDGSQRVASELAWQLIPELGDPVTRESGPLKSVRMRLIHPLTDKLQDLQFELISGPGLYENHLVDYGVFHVLRINLQVNRKTNSNVLGQLSILQARQSENGFEQVTHALLVLRELEDSPNNLSYELTAKVQTGDGPALMAMFQWQPGNVWRKQTSSTISSSMVQ